MPKVGCPTKYQEIYNEQVYKLCLLGATDVEIADFFDVHVDTIYEWKHVHPEFSESIKRGKLIADATISESLYKSANGYEHIDTDIRVCDNEVVETPVMKYYPPNATSLIFWLKNRQPAKWRDKVDLNHGGQEGNPVQITQVPNISIPNPHEPTEQATA